MYQCRLYLLFTFMLLAKYISHENDNFKHVPQMNENVQWFRSRVIVGSVCPCSKVELEVVYFVEAVFLFISTRFMLLYTDTLLHVNVLMDILLYLTIIILKLVGIFKDTLPQVKPKSSRDVFRVKR